MVLYWSNFHVKTSQTAYEEKFWVVKFRALNNSGEAEFKALRQLSLSIFILAFFAIKSRFFTEKEQKKVKNLLSKLFLSVCFRLVFYLYKMLCFYPQQGKGQALALSWTLALGREGRREALVTSTLSMSNFHHGIVPI